MYQFECSPKNMWVKMIERRRYRRYLITDDSIRVYRHSDKKMGWQRDVCKGGSSNLIPGGWYMLKQLTLKMVPLGDNEMKFATFEFTFINWRLVFTPTPVFKDSFHIFSINQKYLSASLALSSKFACLLLISYHNNQEYISWGNLLEDRSQMAKRISNHTNQLINSEIIFRLKWKNRK